MVAKATGDNSVFSVLMISTLSDISSYGTRALTSLLRSRQIDTDLLFTRSASLFDQVVKKRAYGVVAKNFEKEFLSFVRPYHVICFTVYTDILPECVQLSSLVKKHYPEKLVLYGGVHATVAPEECLKFADYVCVGEGFISLPSLLGSLKGLFENGDLQKHKKCPQLPQGVWTRSREGVVLKNGPGPVQQDLDALPYPSYDAEHIFIRNNGDKIVALKKEEYEKYLGCSYYTMMSIGCVYSCAYCCNSSFKRLGKDYAKTRWHSAAYICDEITKARGRYDFFSVWFSDDSFIAMDDRHFEQFLHEYPNRVGLPFVVKGVIPGIAARHKGRLEKLIEAGMVGGRVGVQTGSRRQLAIYKRNQTNEEVISVSEIFARYKNKGVRASYDFILDGIDEKAEDIIQTIKLINKLHRPILLNLYSLRIYPGTGLCETGSISSYDRKDSYKVYHPTLGNLIIAATNFLRIPRFIIKWLERDERRPLTKVPRLAIQAVDALIVLKRTLSCNLTGAYGRTPFFIIEFVKAGRFLRRKMHKGLERHKMAVS